MLAVVASPWLIMLAIPAAALGYATIRAAEQDADLATYPVRITDAHWQQIVWFRWWT